jgi:hypothetical protein
MNVQRNYYCTLTPLQILTTWLQFRCSSYYALLQRCAAASEEGGNKNYVYGAQNFHLWQVKFRLQKVQIYFPFLSTAWT